jgi:hypothetical protein
MTVLRRPSLIEGDQRGSNPLSSSNESPQQLPFSLEGKTSLELDTRAHVADVALRVLGRTGAVTRRGSHRDAAA